MGGRLMPKSLARSSRNMHQHVKGKAPITERIRQAISELKFERDNDRFSLTMSFGVSCSDNIEHSKTEETLLLEADCALYHAKNNGRNRVCIA